MIVRENTVIPMTPYENHETYEGYAVISNGGKSTIAGSGATTKPIGVIAEGEDTDGVDSVVLFGSAKVVKVKLVGTVAQFAYGQLYTDGVRFVTDAGSGGRVVCVQFLEAGVSGDLVDAILITPVSYS